MKYGELIGTGNTAAVYEWDEGRVLKLFYQGYPEEAVKKEFHNAEAIKNMNFAKPGVYEIISCEERLGIIYDKAEGESLTDWVMKTGDMEQCAEYMAELHKAIGMNRINNLPDYKDFLKFSIYNVQSVDLEKRKEVLNMIDKLPDGDVLCHGDFHPGNILINDGNAKVIDFMNLCHGDFLYDVARTVFLVEYTPGPAEAGDRQALQQLRKTLADLYLSKMNVTREMIKDYMSVIIAARNGECSNERK